MVDGSFIPRAFSPTDRKRANEEAARLAERRDGSRKTDNTTIGSEGKLILEGGIDVPGGNITLTEDGRVQVYGEGVTPTYQSVAVTSMIQNRLRTHPWTSATYLAPAVWFNQGTTPDGEDAHIGSTYGNDIEIQTPPEVPEFGTFADPANLQRVTSTLRQGTWGANCSVWDKAANPGGVGSGGPLLASTGISVSSEDLWLNTQNDPGSLYAWLHMNSITGAVELAGDGGVNIVGVFTVNGAALVTGVSSVAGKTGAVTLVKGDVGLGNVDNTTDANKPISTATQTALNAKAATTYVDAADAALDSRLDTLEAQVKKRASGTVTVGTSTPATGATASVTFPGGLFTTAPIVMLTKQSANAAKFVPYATSVTASGCTVGLYSGDGTTSTLAIPVAWEAIGT